MIVFLNTTISLSIFKVTVFHKNVLIAGTRLARFYRLNLSKNDIRAANKKVLLYVLQSLLHICKFSSELHLPLLVPTLTMDRAIPIPHLPHTMVACKGTTLRFTVPSIFISNFFNLYSCCKQELLSESHTKDKERKR